MEQIVTGCKDCPFHIITEYYDAFCHHPESGKGGGVHMGKSLGDYENKTPDWCPLNKEPITITKK